MMTENWLHKLIIDTGVIHHSFLSEKEVHVLELYLPGLTSVNEIAKELGLSAERVRQLISNGMGKILLTIRDFELKTARMEELKADNGRLLSELESLKERFKGAISEQEALLPRVNTSNVPVTDMRFTVRALSALESLGIKTLGELGLTTKKDLLALKKAGVKTIHEIINRAAEFGIKINDDQDTE